MKVFAKFVVCSSALIMLSGCQSVLAKIGLGGNRSVDSSAMASASDGTRLELGLAALRTGSPGNAIYHFERAVLDPVNAPDAYNGMGVAYAQLGRADLAERFFNVAIMMKPSDARFSRNLERLYQADEAKTAQLAATKEQKASKIAEAATRAAQDQGLLAKPSVDFVRQGAITLDRRKTPLSRAANGEILIGGASVAASNPASVEVAARTQRDQAQSDEVKVETRGPQKVDKAEKTEVSMISGPIAANFEMPEFCLVAQKKLEEQTARASQGTSKKTVEFPSTKQGYPIRVALGKN